MEIRRAVPDDDPFLYEVFASTRMDEVVNWGWGEQEIASFLSMQWNMQTRSYQMQYPEAVNQIISCKNQPAGRIIFNASTTNIHLIDISLLPSFRNQGIGRTLLQNLQHQASEQDIPVYLSVNPSNPAARLYGRLGFQPCRKSEMVWEMVWRKSATP